MPTTKRVLVTGGLGFIGSHLVDLLQDSGAAVTVVDNLTSHVIDPDEYEHRCTVLRMDARDVRALHPAFEGIYHLASVVGPLRVIERAADVVPAIVSATRAVVDLASASGARLVYVSSSDVYGRGGWLRETERPSPWNRDTPRAAYAQAKLRSEELVLEATESGRVFGAVMRPFNVAGPRQAPEGGFVLPRFLSAALSGEALLVYGDGRQRRSFLHVGEAAEAILRVGESAVTGELFNLGNPCNAVDIRTLAHEVLALTGSSSQVRHIDPKIMYGPFYDDGHEKLPVIDRVVEVTGWRPRRGLRRIILDALETYLRRSKGVGTHEPAA